ncbi:uncharacterized protein [Triticum aestivum]|uniref:uncharacterized protein n=1 Tax=Triticum aestivum TaxID=4565 RepID=UPI001D02BF58|nr:uncharacterized protein LOC123151015 [Triticum aestivum]
MGPGLIEAKGFGRPSTMAGTCAETVDEFIRVESTLRQGTVESHCAASVSQSGIPSKDAYILKDHMSRGVQQLLLLLAVKASAYLLIHGLFEPSKLQNASHQHQESGSCQRNPKQSKRRKTTVKRFCWRKGCITYLPPRPCCRGACDCRSSCLSRHGPSRGVHCESLHQARVASPAGTQRNPRLLC